MKKSARVTLTIVAAVSLSACSRRRVDPCEAASFSEIACQEAVRSGGYFWGGTWYPMAYHYPYPYYYDAYRGHVSRGGRVAPAPAGAYQSAAGAGHSPGSSPSHGVSRGGFGSTGAGHAAGE